MQQPKIRDLAIGRWDSIYAQYGVSQELLNKKNQPCPFCGGKDRFRYTDYRQQGWVICNQCMPSGSDGIDFLMQLTGLTFKQLAGELRAMFESTVVSINVMSQTSKSERAKKALRSIWSESEPVEATDPVGKYLSRRKLDLPKTAQIKIHHSLPYYESDKNNTVSIKGRYPAMIACVQDPAGLPATLHCTYLTESGMKADVGTQRKLKTPSRPWKGGAVRLSNDLPDGVLVVGEGIETVLAYMKRYDLPGWSALNAGNLEHFQPPDEVTSVIIAADNDESFAGQHVAYGLARRLKLIGVEAHVDIAPVTGKDWADIA